MELEADFSVDLSKKLLVAAAGWHQQVYGMVVLCTGLDGSCTTHAVYCDFLSE